MALLQMLTVAVFANVLGVVLSCGGGSPPPPCSWTTCRPEYRDDWAPPGSQGRCVEQFRRAHHLNTVHSGSGSCPAPQPCNPAASQNRLFCSCRKVTCTLQDWGPWVEVPGSNPCVQQRTRGYSTTTSYIDVVGDCRGVPSQPCPSGESETRRRKSTAGAVLSGWLNTAVKDKKFRVLTSNPQMKQPRVLKSETCMAADKH